MYYYYDIYYFILVVPALILAIFAQYKVKSTYKKFSQVTNIRGITNTYTTQTILSHYGINDVRIEQTNGVLTDHYDPKAKVIRLSSGVYSSNSIAAVGIACHEAGHAAQHAENYAPIKIRNSFVPVCNIGSRLGIPIALLGLFMSFEPLIYIGLILYSAVFLFHLVTLPVEFNASRRALCVIEETALLYDDETNGAKKVLTSAAMTYVAAMITALANLLRILLRFSRRND